MIRYRTTITKISGASSKLLVSIFVNILESQMLIIVLLKGLSKLLSILTCLVLAKAGRRHAKNRVGLPQGE